MSPFENCITGECFVSLRAGATCPCVIASPATYPCVIARSEATKQSHHCLFMRLPRPLRFLAMTESVGIATRPLGARNDEEKGVSLRAGAKQRRSNLLLSFPRVIARSEATKQSLCCDKLGLCPIMAVLLFG
jgi:hypothetical protein